MFVSIAFLVEAYRDTAKGKRGRRLLIYLYLRVGVQHSFGLA